MRQMSTQHWLEEVEVQFFLEQPLTLLMTLLSHQRLTADQEYRA